MSLIPPPEVKRSRARSVNDMQAVPGEARAAEPGAAEALIAEARAHARRRRLKVAVALAVLAAAALAAVLIGRATLGSARVAHARPRPAAPAAATGIVTGHLAACFGHPAGERASRHSGHGGRPARPHHLEADRAGNLDDRVPQGSRRGQSAH